MVTTRPDRMGECPVQPEFWTSSLGLPHPPSAHLSEIPFIWKSGFVVGWFSASSTIEVAENPVLGEPSSLDRLERIISSA